MTYLQCGCFSWFGTQDHSQCGQAISPVEQKLKQMDVVISRYLLSVGSESVCLRTESVPVLSGAWWEFPSFLCIICGSNWKELIFNSSRDFYFWEGPIELARVKIFKKLFVFCWKYMLGEAVEKTQWVRMFVCRPKDLSSNPSIHIKG